MNYNDLRENYYALFLSIVKRMSADDSIMAIIGIREREFQKRLSGSEG